MCGCRWLIPERWGWGGQTALSMLAQFCVPSVTEGCKGRHGVQFSFSAFWVVGWGSRGWRKKTSVETQPARKAGRSLGLPQESL